MLKRLLLSAIVLSAISGSSYAVDVKLPGADPSISRDAYVQAVYTTDKIESTYDERLKKKADSFSAYSKERFNQEFGVVVDDDAVEALKNEIYTIERRKYDGNTVVNLPYNVILYPRVTESVTSNDINKIMANYVLPSIHSLQDLDDYSRVENYKKYSFRVPKTAVKENNPNVKIDGVTFTVDKDIRQQILIDPANNLEKGIFSSFDEIDLLHKLDNKTAEFFGFPGSPKITKGSHSFVWNDGMPGLLLDLELDNRQGILMFITYDDSFKYQNSIHYPLDNGAYTKVQLRKLITDATLSDTGNMYQEDVWFI